MRLGSSRWTIASAASAPLDVVGGPRAARRRGCRRSGPGSCLRRIRWRCGSWRRRPPTGWFPADARHKTRRAARSRSSQPASGIFQSYWAKCGCEKATSMPTSSAARRISVEAQVRARLATVVMRVNEIDADPLQPQQALLGPRVAGRRGADLGVVQRQRPRGRSACR